MILATVGCSDHSVYKQKRPGESHPPDRGAGEVMTNSIGMRLVYIAAGEFTMGSGMTCTAMSGNGAAPPTKQLVNRSR